MPPSGITPDDWTATPPAVRQFIGVLLNVLAQQQQLIADQQQQIAQLQARIVALEAQLKRALPKLVQTAVVRPARGTPTPRARATRAEGRRPAGPSAA
jgi:hypothetical protein